MVHAPVREQEADARGRIRRIPPEALLPREHFWGSRYAGLVAMATEGDHGGARPLIGQDLRICRQGAHLCGDSAQKVPNKSEPRRSRVPAWAGLGLSDVGAR